MKTDLTAVLLTQVDRVIVRHIQTDGLRLNRVMLCWDGSRNAARAIADAQPFLTRAKAITLVTVSDVKTDECATPLLGAKA